MLKKFTLLLAGFILALNAYAEPQYYQVKEGERIEEIFINLGYGYNYEQVKPFIDKTFRRHPDAFENGDINRIITGYNIYLPNKPRNVKKPEPKPVVVIKQKPVPEPEPSPIIIGNIEITSGEVNIQRDDKIIAVDQQSILNENDIILTPAGSMAEIYLTDKSRFTLGPDSKFSIDQYSYTPKVADTSTVVDKKNAEDSLITTIHKGVLRAITGLISKYSRDSYQVKSSLTVIIGVRGTDFTVRNCIDKIACGDLYGVSAAVVDGGISFKNDSGTVDLDTNQFTIVETIDQTPESAPVPEGFFQLDLPASQIEVSKPWWQAIYDWFASLFGFDE